MIGATLYNPGMLRLLWTAGLVAGLMSYGWRRRQTCLGEFADQGILERLGGQHKAWREALKVGCACGAVVLIVLSLCRPAWNAKAVALRHSGRDIVFVLDVSRSMLAPDLQPNRLERAKRAIIDCSEGLSGERVGLVVFAGSASIKCPLTRDYSFFRTVLTDISWDSAEIGGTRIGDALQLTAEHLLNERRGGYQDIVLLTDGEDHDSRPEEAAALLQAGGMRLIAIGIGDAYQGRRVQVEDEAGTTAFLQFQGQEVWSKLNAPLLRRIVDATGQGAFWEVGTGVIDLAGIYDRDLATAQRIQSEAQTVQVYEEQFQRFLAGALVLLLLRRAGAFGRSLAARVALLVICCGVLGQAVQADEAEGLRAYQEGRFAEAVTAFQQVLDAQGKTPERLYNLGVSLYKHGDYEQAADAFSAVAAGGVEAALKLRSVYNQGNCLFRRAAGMAQWGPDGLAMNKDALTKMIALYTESIRLFRTVLYTDERFDKAAFNLEVAKIRLDEATAALQSTLAAEKTASKQFVQARKTLSALMARQEQLADETADVIDWQTAYAIPRILVAQQLILTETLALAKLMEQLRGKLPLTPSEGNQEGGSEVSSLQPCLDQLAKSIKAEGSALHDLTGKRLEPGNEQQYMAFDALALALERFPRMSKLKGEEEEDPGAQGKWTGRVEDGDASAEGPVFEITAGQIDPIALTAPDLSPEAILREEIMNRRQRQRKRSAQYGNVERNW